MYRIRAKKMTILFITHFFYPHIGGVEKHVLEISRQFVKKGIKVEVLTENYNGLKKHETINGINVNRFPYSKIKFFGLIKIWLAIWQHRNLIKNANIVHIHDVFVWYLPFRFLYPKKVVYTTFHGWEGVWPIPKWNIFLKRLAVKLSHKTIAVGKYIEKYYGIKTNKIIYGGQNINRSTGVIKKVKNSIIFVGRLNKDTGVLRFLEYLKDCKTKYIVNFIGDGVLKKECKKFGKVWGFCDPSNFYKTAEYAVPAGYLSYIEAKSFKCKILVYPNNPLKKDYWEEIQKVKGFPSWQELANEYITLYNNSK